MKILFKEGKYTKVSNDMEADQKVRKFGYRYAKKSEYNINVRDVKKAEAELEAVKVAKQKEEKNKNAKNTNRAKTNVR
jgi:hypothetical protein